MIFDPRQATVIEAIGTGICVGLVAYLAYLVFLFWRQHEGYRLFSSRSPRHRSPASST